MGKTTAAKKPFGKKAPFGTTKGAFGKEGKGGAKGKGKGGRPLAKMECGQEKTKRGGEAVFDDNVRRDWVTGYGKRKTQRRKYAVKQAEEKARKERLQERKERREEFRKTHGLTDDAGGGDGDSKPAGAVDTEVVEYDSGVTVIVEGID